MTQGLTINAREILLNAGKSIGAVSDNALAAINSIYLATEKLIELEKLLAECHAKLKETRELVGDQWVSIREPFEIEQRIENYFAGNGAILYGELEILEEDVIVSPHKPMGEMLSEIMENGTMVNMIGGISTLTLWANGEIKASFKLPTGYFMRIRTDYSVSTTPAWFLENEVTGENHFLHLVNSITELSDDEIKVIQARIDEVTA
jgi:hypothetical protein